LFFDESGKLWVTSHTEGLMVFDSSTSTLIQAAKTPYYFSALKGNTRFSEYKIYKEKLWHSSWRPDIGVYDFAKKANTILYDEETPQWCWISSGWSIAFI
jgi:hypothetical protein